MVAVLTLNILRPSRCNLKRSAYNELWRNFDFNKTLLAPPGCLIVAHKRAQEKGTVFFIGPAKYDYQNYRVYIPATIGERTTDTIEFFLEHVQMPQTSSEDRLASATKNLIAIWKKLHPPTPFLDQGTKTNDNIRKLQKIFTPRQQNEAFTRVMERGSTRMNQTATRVVLPTIDEVEIGMIIMKNYNNKIQRGEVTHEFEDEKRYFIVYKSGDDEKISHRLLN